MIASRKWTCVTKPTYLESKKSNRIHFVFTDQASQKPGKTPVIIDTIQYIAELYLLINSWII